MLILTDFPRFPKHWKTAPHLEGESSTALAGASPREIFKLIPEIRRADLILVHESGSKILWLVLLFWIAPFLKKPIISVDLILRKPHSGKEKVVAWLKRILLKRVDHFIHYFRRLEGYEKIYGISPGRSSYVPFKANIFGDPRVSQMASSEAGEYVYMAGQSLRDFDTFMEAITPLNRSEEHT